MDEIHLVSGPVGPLFPQVPAAVPLWLAIYLVKRNQCRMRPPEWLSRKELEDLLRAEKDKGSDAFGVLPSEYFVEIATLFFQHGQESLGERERCVQLVEQIVDLRKVKVMEGLA